MGLSHWLRRRVAVVPFVVDTPGGASARVAVEREIRERGWRQADSPAAAGLLVVAGPVDDEFGTCITRVFDSMALPRDRATVTEPVTAAAELDAAVSRLRACVEAAPQSYPESDSGPHASRNHADGNHAAWEHAAPSGHEQTVGEHDSRAHHAAVADLEHDDHGSSAHSADQEVDPTAHAGAHDQAVVREQGAAHEHMEHMEHAAVHEHMSHTRGGAEHGGHDHDMGMMMPGGLAMADRADDRDGLKLDVLTVPLGPVLAWWPAGLTVATRWQGDIVCAAKVSVQSAPSGTVPFWLQPWLRAGQVNADERGRWRAARALDSTSRLLAVAGWSDEATTARRLRDEMLAGDLSTVGGTRLRRWARRVAGSAVLRWSLRDVGRIAAGPGVPAELVGDAHDRLLRWIAESDPVPLPEEQPAAPSSFVGGQIGRCQWIIDALPVLLTGSELAEVRLIVASLDPDTEVLTASVAMAAHG